MLTNMARKTDKNDIIIIYAIRNIYRGGLISSLESLEKQNEFVRSVLSVVKNNYTFLLMWLEGRNYKMTNNTAVT